MFSTIQYN